MLLSSMEEAPSTIKLTTEITKLNGSVCEGNEPSRLCQKSEC